METTTAVQLIPSVIAWADSLPEPQKADALADVGMFYLDVAADMLANGLWTTAERETLERAYLEMLFVLSLDIDDLLEVLA